MNASLEIRPADHAATAPATDRPAFAATGADRRRGVLAEAEEPRRTVDPFTRRLMMVAGASGVAAPSLVLAWWLLAAQPAGGAELQTLWQLAGAGLLFGLLGSLALWRWVLQPAQQAQAAAEQRERSQSQRDNLTQMLNREGLRMALDQALQRWRQKGVQVGLVVVDLDRFHLINDSMGQPVGDEVLRTAAQRIRGVVRERDKLARLSADRFVVLVTGLAGEQTMAVMARNLIRAFEPACKVGGRDMVLTPSIGTATADEHTAQNDELLKCAELALRAAKGAGGGVARHFEASLLEQHHLWLDMENRLRHTVHQSGFVLAYQPIFESTGTRIKAVEALLRWPEKDRARQVSPAVFVPVLEQTGLIVPVGRWVLQQSCQQALKWLAQGAQDLTLSVNVSPRQFAEADFAEHVALVLAQTGFPAQRLQIEVTEGLLLDPSAETLRKLELLVQTGVQLAVDDFGIGHSSLAYLKTFPLHTLKIDRMFVRDLLEHPREVAIARAIIELGHSLGLQVTAEGVELAEQAQILHRLGCDSLQGFLLARPCTPRQVTAMLAERGTAPRADALSASWSETMAGLLQPA